MRVALEIYRLAGSVAAEGRADNRNDPRIRQGFHRGRDVLTASLASDRELTEPGLGHVEHKTSIGEHKGKESTVCTVSTTSTALHAPFLRLVPE